MKSVIKLLIYTQTLSPGTLKSIKSKIYRYLVIILSAYKKYRKRLISITIAFKTRGNMIINEESV